MTYVRAPILVGDTDDDVNLLRIPQLKKKIKAYNVVVRMITVHPT